MICTKCNTDGIENEALGKKFWYCRTCKEEIKPQPEPKPDDNEYPFPYWGLNYNTPWADALRKAFADMMVFGTGQVSVEYVPPMEMEGLASWLPPDPSKDWSIMDDYRAHLANEQESVLKQKNYHDCDNCTICDEYEAQDRPENNCE